jgi:chemotaxis protein histidine kinase CheA
MADQHYAEPSSVPAAPGATGLDPVSVEEARRQVKLLLESLASLRDSPRQGAVMDEVYRAAHSLKSEVDEARFEQVARIARLIQEIVRAVRAERVPVTDALGDALASAARAAGESLEATVAGAPDPGSAAAVAGQLAAFLAGSPAGGSSQRAEGAMPITFARVDRGRMEAAEQAARDAFAAAADFSVAAGDVAAVRAAFQSMRESQERSQKDLLDALPEALANVARGAPPTTLAGELARRISAMGTAAAQFEESLARFSGRVRDAARSGSRAASLCGDALRRIRTVALSTAFAGFPKLVRRLAGRLSVTIDAAVAPGEIEIDASWAELAETAFGQCLRASLAPRGRSAAKNGRGRTFLATVDARKESGIVVMRLVLEGNVPSEESLEAKLSPLSTRLKKRNVVLGIESRRGAQATFSLSFSETAIAAELPRSYVVGRTGDVTYAIPAASVERLIDATPSSARGGQKLSFVKVGDSSTAKAGALVREGRGKTVLLFDSLEGEESLYATSMSTEDSTVFGVSSAATRADGSVALVLDVASFLSSRHARKRKPRR